ncbi:MAG: AarF/UbiB family protein, partial [Microbacterium sp.]
VEEFARTSLEEVDYLHEAAVAERFAAAFADDPRVAAPAVAWERTTRRVLTLSDVTAIKINDHAALRAAGIDPADVADVFADVMFDQFFTHGYFHADPHPGNIFVTPAGPQGGADAPESPSPGSAPAWHLTFVDFGMMGEVPSGMREGLRALVMAVAARDGAGLVKAAQQIGVLLPSADTRELERALTALFARFGGLGFAELREVDPHEFQDFAREFGDVARSLPVQLPEGLLLLFRAVSLTSGMCSSLDPAFNIWDAVEPYAARLLREESAGLVADLAKQALTNTAVIWRLPGRIEAVIDRIEGSTVAFDTSRIDRRLDRLDRLVRRGVGAVLFAGTLLGGVLLLPTHPVFGGILMGVSVAPLLYALFARTPR